MDSLSECEAFLDTWREELDKTDPEADQWDHAAAKGLFEAAEKLHSSCKRLELTIEREVSRGTTVVYYNFIAPLNPPPLSFCLCVRDPRTNLSNSRVWVSTESRETNPQAGERQPEEIQHGTEDGKQRA